MYLVISSALCPCILILHNTYFYFVTKLYLYIIGFFVIFVTSLCMFCFKEHAGPSQVSYLLIFLLKCSF